MPKKKGMYSSGGIAVPYKDVPINWEFQYIHMRGVTAALTLEQRKELEEDFKKRFDKTKKRTNNE